MPEYECNDDEDTVFLQISVLTTRNVLFHFDVWSSVGVFFLQLLALFSSLLQQMEGSQTHGTGWAAGATLRLY